MKSKTNNITTTNTIEINNNNNIEKTTNKFNTFLKDWWITGFTDAEGCFSTSICKSNLTKSGWSVQPSFNIELDIRDSTLLDSIQKFFSAGTIRYNIRKNKSKSVLFSVRSIKELNNVIIPHFDKYPLLTQKKNDFIKFKAIIDIINKKEHLTKKGLDKILCLRQLKINNLSERMDNSNKLITNAPDLNWLVGFIDGDGCFFVNLQKNNRNKTGYGIYLKLQITQHLRDEILLKSLIKLLNCGRIQKESKRPVIQFVVSKLKDISEKIIPIFNKYPLQSSKKLDYNDFCEILKLMENKSHLTLDGMIKINKIKLKMNKKRRI